jgi:hypothetical protein
MRLSHGTNAPRAPASTTTSSRRAGPGNLGRIGFDDSIRAVEVMVALRHATQEIAAIIADDDTADGRTDPRASRRRPRFIRPGHSIVPCFVDYPAMHESTSIRRELFIRRRELFAV